MGMQQVAVAVFVKTIGFTPLKTRLAKDLGQERAHEFYRLSCGAIHELLKTSDDRVVPFWATAESVAEVRAHWPDFTVIDQGEGGLGDRLAKVYGQLLADHRAVLLLGADAPQLSAPLVRQAVEALDSGQREFVVGPARDGGFYLFGGSRSLAEGFWQSVPYSTRRTCDRLVEKLSGAGPIRILPVLSDVDVREDLVFLKRELSEIPEPSARQRALLDWLDRHG